MTNLSFHLVKYDNWTKVVYILSRYIKVPTNLTKVVLFEVSSTKPEISRFAPLS